MLNLNVQNMGSQSTLASPSATADSQLRKLTTNDCVWKVLIYDQLGQEIIAPLLRISDLRENGITMHMYIPMDIDALLELLYFLFICTYLGSCTLKDIRFQMFQQCILFHRLMRMWQGSAKIWRRACTTVITSTSRPWLPVTYLNIWLSLRSRPAATKRLPRSMISI